MATSSSRFFEVSIPLWFDWKLYALLYVDTILCFNSTLVRLEAFWAWRSSSWHPFQFHFGSIGSFAVLKVCAIMEVSIPLWFDWKSEWNAKFVFVNKFQFHFGSIGRLCPCRKIPWKDVSIPLWFDWKTFAFKVISGIPLFQFHFGSIGSLEV